MFTKKLAFLPLAIVTTLGAILSRSNASPTTIPLTDSSPAKPLANLGSADPQCVDVNIDADWKSLSGSVNAADCLAALAQLQHRAGPDRSTEIKFFSKIYYPVTVVTPGAWPVPDGGQNSMASSPSSLDPDLRRRGKMQHTG